MRIARCLLLLSLASCGAHLPSTFVASAPGWRSVELNDGLRYDYDEAWQKTVDTIARNWDIEVMDKGSGYLRTNWLYGISGANPQLYRARLTVKFPETKKPTKVDIRTNAQWLRNRKIALWVDGFDTNFDRDAYAEISGRLGRTIPAE